MKAAGFIILCFLFHPVMVYSQGLALSSVRTMDSLRIRFKSIHSFQLKEEFNKPAVKPPKQTFRSPYNHSDDLGFFCQWELKLDKQVSKAIRFRLGSVDYVNRMEGK